MIDDGIDYMDADMIPQDITKIEKYSDLQKTFIGNFESFNYYDKLVEDVSSKNCY